MNEIKAFYLTIMDHQHNPLRFLNPANQFRIMVLMSWRWSMVFSVSFLSILYFQWVWLAHVLLASALLCTVWLFKHIQSMAEPAHIQQESTRCIWDLEREA